MVKLKVLEALGGIEEVANDKGLSSNEALEVMLASGDVSTDVIAEPQDRQGISALGAALATAGLSLDSNAGDLLFNGSSGKSVNETGANFFGYLLDAVGNDTVLMATSESDNLHQDSGIVFSSIQRVIKTPVPTMTATVKLADIVSRTTTVNAGEFSTIPLDNGKPIYSRVAPGAEIPPTLFKLRKVQNDTEKYAARVDFDYETIRSRTIRHLLELFRDSKRRKLENFVNDGLLTLINGDGNNNGAVSTTLPDVAWTAKNIRDYLSDLEYNHSIPAPSLFIGDLTQVNAIGDLVAPATTPKTAFEINLASVRYLMPDMITRLKLAPKNSVLQGFKGLLGVTVGGGLELLREKGSTISEKSREITTQQIIYTDSFNMAFGKPSDKGAVKVGLS